MDLNNYYEILELPRSADAHQIRSAYKRLAMQYHPDRNMGDKQAEEIFKKINEAYHILSDPIKKSRYDDRFNRTIPYDTHAHDTHRRTQHHRAYSQPRPAQQRYYKIDRNYFKIQGLAVLVFFVLASICFGIAHTVRYFVSQQQLEEWMATTMQLRQVNSLFESGRINEALTLVSDLKAKDPMEYRYIFARDSLIGTLGSIADKKIKDRNYAAAIEHLFLLRQYQDPVTMETLRKIAYCEYHLGNFPEALRALKHLHNQNPDDLELIYQIGMINQEKTGNPEEALQYFDLGKQLFKQNLTRVYGEAFEVVMDPRDAPDVYYEIFLGRAKANIQLEHFGEAVTDGNWAIYLRRDEAEGYYLRALAKSKAKIRDSLCDDIGQAVRLGAQEAQALQDKHCR